MRVPIAVLIANCGCDTILLSYQVNGFLHMLMEYDDRLGVDRCSCTLFQWLEQYIHNSDLRSLRVLVLK